VFYLVNKVTVFICLFIFTHLPFCCSLVATCCSLVASFGVKKSFCKNDVFDNQAVAKNLFATCPE
jgi:hypothetical protein